MPLDDSISPDQPGHIADHEEIAARLNAITAVFTEALKLRIDDIENLAAAEITTTALAAAGAEIRLIWDGVTWPARPLAVNVPRVTYDSQDDPAATEPSDSELVYGDGWDLHPDAV
jgi:hypothetical protein